MNDVEAAEEILKGKPYMDCPDCSGTGRVMGMLNPAKGVIHSANDKKLRAMPLVGQDPSA